MGTRKPKKPEKKGFLDSLLAGFGIGKKKTSKKKSSAKGGKGGPVRKGTGPIKKPRSAQPAATEAFDLGLDDDLLPSAPAGGSFGDMDDELFAGLEFGNNPPDMNGMLPPQPPTAPPAYQAEQRVPQAPAPTPQPSSAAAIDYDNSKLFPDGVDSSLDALFDSFEVGGAPATPAAPPPSMPTAAAPPVAAAPPAAAPAPPGAPTQPFQGQAPAAPQARPAAAPGRPQPPAPGQAGQPPAGDGLVSIGKLLVDQNTLKRIIDNAEKRGAGLYTTTKVISESRGQDLDAILHVIDRCQGVAGSMIVGRDGLVISSTLPPEYEKEMIGAIASSMQTNLDVQCKKMKLGPARQIIVDTEGGVLLLMALEVGVLVVLSQSLMQLDLAGVLQAIATAAESA